MRKRVAICRGVVLLAAMTLVRALLAEDAAVMHRRPAAAVLSHDETVLYVANRRSGTLSTIDLQTKTVTERPVAQQLAALVRRPDSTDVLAVDFAAGELIVFEDTGAALLLRQRIETATWPGGVAVSPDGTVCCVASLWSRQATLITLSARGFSRKPAIVDLPLAARAVAFLDERHVVLADAFGGRLAVLDCEQQRLVSVWELPIHNIRQLAVDGDRLLLTHQTLNPAARTEAEHIHWGVLMQNELSTLPIAALRDPQADLDKVRTAISIGGPGNGAGDPEAIVPLNDRFLVGLGGTDEVALIDRVGVREVRVATGSRPVAVVVNCEETQAFVVNELDDSVTIIDLQENEPTDEISLGPRPVTGLAERGERAFFSARLSLESWMSCHSCHTDGHTSNQLADTLGDGDYGDAKRIPSLLGVWSTGPWAWNGKHAVLRSQVAASLRSTMHTQDYRLDADAGAGDATPVERPGGEAGDNGEETGVSAVSQLQNAAAAELDAYLTTLSRPPSVAEARLVKPAPQYLARGAAVFEASGCVSCHDPFTSLTTDGAFDVGLTDRAGRRHFNPPSLGGVSQRDRLLHDGRATSLSDVLTRFSHPNGLSLPDADREALLAYLRSL